MRRLFCGLIILILCSICLYSYAEDSSSTNENNSNTASNTVNNDANNNVSTNSTITNLQDKQKELLTQMEESGGELTQVQDELTENLQQIQILDEKIEQSEQELQELQEKIEKVTQNTLQLKKKLAVARKHYETQKKLMQNRLISMYESGDTEYLDVVLKSTNLSEFLSSYCLINEIASYDKELLEDVQNRKEIIELANEKLEENYDKLSIMKKNQETNTKILQNTKVLRNQYADSLTNQEKEIQSKIDEYKSQFEQVNKEILEIALKEGLSADYIGGELAWPVPGYTKITSDYGMRVHPITGVYKLHTGVDIYAPIGANFVAANNGIVTKACYNSAYGNMVIVDHGGGISTLYAHGSEILVQVGQTVTRGEPVLKVGSTGYSTGAHAHFEVRINGVVTNPIEYITKGKIPEVIKKLEKNENESAEENNSDSNKA